MGVCESKENELNIQNEACSENSLFYENNDRNNNYVNENNVEIMRIELLEKGQKIKQFKDMANNQHYLNDSEVEGASPNFYTTKVFDKGISNILQGFYCAYENHLPIRLTPDIIWLLIVQGFSHHVNFNSEYLRDSFVNFEGKKTLQMIIRKYHSYKQMKPKDYENLFENLTGQIKDYVGEELVDTLNFNFSTSNKITKTVGYTTIMSSMKKYFEYVCK